jgi:hypothetical protein
MENNFKGYMEDRFKKLKQSASQLVANRGENGEEDDTSIELDPRDYEILKLRAERQHTTVSALVRRAVKQMLDTTAADGRLQITVEQKERNPLLYLDGITQNLD